MPNLLQDAASREQQSETPRRVGPLRTGPGHSPQLLEGPVHVLLQAALRSSDQLRLLLQLLLHGVRHQFRPPPPLPQRQALGADLQRKHGTGQVQLGPLLGLSPQE